MTLSIGPGGHLDSEKKIQHFMVVMETSAEGNSSNGYIHSTVNCEGEDFP